MELQPFSKYVDGVEKIISEHPQFQKRKLVFLSTDDPTIIEEAKTLGPQRGIEFFWTHDVQRIGGAVSPMSIARQMGESKLALHSFLNLHMAVAADAWVQVRMDMRFFPPSLLRC